MIRVRIGALLAVTTIVFAACGGATTSSAPSAAAPSGAAASAAPVTSGAPSAAPSSAAGTPKDGGNLIVALPGEIATTDSAFSQDSNTSYVLNQVVEGLVALKPGTVGDTRPRPRQVVDGQR